MPEYSADHDYTFILDTGLLDAAQLHFGVSDGGFSDNSGAYNITITQLSLPGIDPAAVPEPGSIALLLVSGIGGAGLLLRRRREADWSVAFDITLPNFNGYCNSQIDSFVPVTLESPNRKAVFLSDPIPQADFLCVPSATVLTLPQS